MRYTNIEFFNTNAFAENCRLIKFSFFSQFKLSRSKMNILKQYPPFAILYAIFAMLQNCYLIYVCAFYGNELGYFFFGSEESYFLFFVVFLLLRLAALITVIFGFLASEVWLLHISNYFTTAYLFFMIWAILIMNKIINYNDTPNPKGKFALTQSESFVCCALGLLMINYLTSNLKTFIHLHFSN